MAKVDNEIFSVPEYPTNDNKLKTKTATAHKEIKQITKAKKLQEPIGKRLARIFLGEEITDVRGYLVHDILIPAARSMIADIGLSIFGVGSSNRSNSMRVDFRGISSRRSKIGTYPSEDYRAARHRGYTNPVFDTREQAREVLDSLADAIEEYDEVTVGDFYSMVGFDSEHTDEQFGWTSVGSAKIKRGNGGYIIDLPRPKVL